MCQLKQEMNPTEIRTYTHDNKMIGSYINAQLMMGEKSECLKKVPETTYTPQLKLICSPEMNKPLIYIGKI